MHHWGYNPIRPRPTSGSSATTSSSPSVTTLPSPPAWQTLLGKFVDLGGEEYHKMMASQRPAAHPYRPAALRLDGYVNNDISGPGLLLQFGGALCVVLAAVGLALARYRPALKSQDRAVVLWFVLTGCLHTIFEGYFVYNHARMPCRMDLLGQLWKEYALSDSRYLTGDTFVLSIETVTALVWGPLSFFAAYMVTTFHPLRHSLQTIVSLAHIYGCVLYFATATVDSYSKDTSHGRPELIYFWIYYFGMNFVFIVIPGSKFIPKLAEPC